MAINERTVMRTLNRYSIKKIRKKIPAIISQETKNLRLEYAKHCVQLGYEKWINQAAAIDEFCIHPGG